MWTIILYALGAWLLLLVVVLVGLAYDREHTPERPGRALGFDSVESARRRMHRELLARSAEEIVYRHAASEGQLRKIG